MLASVSLPYSPKVDSGTARRTLLKISSVVKSLVTIS